MKVTVYTKGMTEFAEYTFKTTKEAEKFSKAALKKSYVTAISTESK